jgi:putative drug exporter of the RND superfamily
VFLTFALSGPRPLKEMGIILGIAVLLDATDARAADARADPAAPHRPGADWWLLRRLDRLLPDVRFGH